MKIKRVPERVPTDDELEAIYNLLGLALPLALAKLEAGGVPVYQQWEFWQYFEALCNVIDEEPPLLNDLMEILTPESTKNPLSARLEWLRGWLDDMGKPMEPEPKPES